MPFREIDVEAEINKRVETDPAFREAWENSRMEYKILGELVKLRKEKGLSQTELAFKTGNKQQVISRIEKNEESPTLKTLCSIAIALGVDIKIVPAS